MMDAHSMVGSIGWTLLDFTWQGALIGCATALLLTAMRNARPRQRYAVACGALLLCLAWPACGLVARMSEGVGVDAGVRVVDRLLLSAQGAADAGLLGWLQDRLLWIVCGWALCAGLLTVRMGLGLLWIGRVAQGHAGDAAWQARLTNMAVQHGITRTVRLRVVDQLASPITAGWWRPVVLVPAALISGMPPELLEALLAHELGHIKRLDYLVNLGQNAIEIVLFFHPAVWWISGQIRLERELIADDFAAQALGQPRRLALALSELERLQFSTQHLAIAASGGDLMSRIKRLVRPDTAALNWKAALPVLGLAVCLSACAAMKSADSASADTPPVLTQAIADFKTCKKPVWPAAALKDERTGTVTLKFVISPQGKVIDSAVANSSGHTDLDEAARNGIALCSFIPATRNGAPIEAPMQMQYIWTLH
jgi:bla regulator protein BlaR1